MEVSIGTTLPVLLFPGKNGRGPLVVGIEAAVFARFGLQVLERELIASDWVFAVPVVWHRDRGLASVPVLPHQLPHGGRVRPPFR